METQISCTNLNVERCTEHKEHWRVQITFNSKQYTGKRNFQGWLTVVDATVLGSIICTTHHSLQ